MIPADRDALADIRDLLAELLIADHEARNPWGWTQPTRSAEYLTAWRRRMAGRYPRATAFRQQGVPE